MVRGQKCWIEHMYKFTSIIFDYICARVLLHVYIKITKKDIRKYGSNSKKYEKCCIHQQHNLNENDNKKMVTISMYYQSKRKWKRNSYNFRLVFIFCYEFGTQSIVEDPPQFLVKSNQKRGNEKATATTTTIKRKMKHINWFKLYANKEDADRHV